MSVVGLIFAILGCFVVLALFLAYAVLSWQQIQVFKEISKIHISDLYRDFYHLETTDDALGRANRAKVAPIRQENK